MRIKTKSIVSVLLSFICILGLFPAQAFAAGAIDTDEDAHLSIEYKDEDEAVSGVSFELYYVASVDAYGEFSLTGDFTNYPVRVNDLDSAAWKALAETLSGYVDRDKIQPFDTGNTDEEGILNFPNGQSDMKPGLYLAIGRQHVDEKGYIYDTEPFLVAIPALDLESNTWVYDVTATPKYTKEPPAPPEQVVERKVIKVWKDDTKEVRPDQVIVQLLKDGTVYDTVTLNDANNWQYLWEKLPEYNEDGGKIDWKVVESEVKDYTVQITEEGITFVVTNTFDSQELTVQKKWDDKGYESKRPKSVTVSLLQNGQVYDTQTLTEERGWNYTWGDLPKVDSNGNEIKWTIKESDVSGYTADVEQKGYMFILTNTYDKPKLPQTGQLWWPVPLLVMGGMAFIIVGAVLRKKKGNNEKI